VLSKSKSAGRGVECIDRCELDLNGKVLKPASGIPTNNKQYIKNLNLQAQAIHADRCYTFLCWGILEVEGLLAHVA